MLLVKLCHAALAKGWCITVLQHALASTGCGQLVGKRRLAILSRPLSCDTMLVYDAESILP